MRAAVYARVSSEEQVGGYSLRSQEELCRRRALELGAEEVVAFVERGVPGDTLDRPELERLRGALRRRAFDLVVVLDPDRLARSLALQLLLTEEITRSGARLEFVGYEWRDTPDGRLFYALRGAIAEYEREKIRERTTRGKLAKARAGGIINAPRTYGYRFDPEGDRLLPDPATAPVVQLLFAWAEEGLGPAAIARRLAALGIPAPGGGPRWWARTVARILRNETYRGRLRVHRWSITRQGRRRRTRERPRDEWSLVEVPPLVEAERWEAVQRRLRREEAAGARGATPFLLGGLVRCGHCGAPMVGQSRRQRSRLFRYYVCRSARRAGATPLAGAAGSPPPPAHGRYVPADLLEARVWAAVEERLTGLAAPGAEAGAGEAQGAGAERRARRRLLVDRLRALRRARERTLWAFQQGFLSAARYASESERLRAERSALLREAAALRAEAGRGRRSRGGGEEGRPPAAGRAREPEWALRRRILAELVERIEVTADAAGRAEVRLRLLLPPGAAGGAGVAAPGSRAGRLSAWGDDPPDHHQADL
ncbi:MAG: recombinase family protein [Bacillota bacterium]|nr:recombinase family protein [Bacillota bacterium]